MERPQTFSTDVAGTKLTVEIGGLAGQANGAVRAQLGDTVVLATAVMSKVPREGIDYLPLMVDFDEKLYAAGRIKGSRWIKREGRPSDEAILTSRLIDRTVRPLFNGAMRNDVQIIATVLSFDGENDPDIVAIFAASVALAVSDIPWEGPVSAVRVSLGENGSTIINPSYEARDKSALDVVVSGPEGLVNMLEGRADEVPDEKIAEAIAASEEARSSLIAFQKEIVQKAGREKVPAAALEEPSSELAGEVASAVGSRLEEALFAKTRAERSGKAEALRQETASIFEKKYPESEHIGSRVGQVLEEMSKKIVQTNILERERRVDGRALDEIRPLSASVGVLPRTHGSALFNRGSTQALSILTLGAPGLEQSLETMELVGTKRFMHHYNFPPYSVGETGRLFTGRREIGHGALAENAVRPLIPPKEEFPYVIRIVTEILSSNGSTSMASVCGSSLALMDAGVPVREAAAGISTGIVIANEERPEERYALLTDIQGVEDFYGHMDFKVAGTKNGVTALQADMKVRGITHRIIAEAFSLAKEARGKILAAMSSALSSPRAELSPYAPRVLTLKIGPDKIRNVIGPGGKVINQITEETGATIDIEDDGTVFITSTDKAAAEKAREWVANITRDVEPGEVFTGKVARLLKFGAFVEILPNKQGLVHISELSDTYVEKVENVVRVGDMVRVKVKNIDEEGRINLTMKGVGQEGASENSNVQS